MGGVFRPRRRPYGASTGPRRAAGKNRVGGRFIKWGEKLRSEDEDDDEGRGRLCGASVRLCAFWAFLRLFDFSRHLSKILAYPGPNSGDGSGHYPQTQSYHDPVQPLKLVQPVGHCFIEYGLVNCDH